MIGQFTIETTFIPNFSTRAIPHSLAIFIVVANVAVVVVDVVIVFVVVAFSCRARASRTATKRRLLASAGKLAGQQESKRASQPASKQEGKRKPLGRGERESALDDGESACSVAGAQATTSQTSERESERA